MFIAQDVVFAAKKKAGREPAAKKRTTKRKPQRPNRASPKADGPVPRGPVLLHKEGGTPAARDWAAERGRGPPALRLAVGYLLGRCGRLWRR